MRVERHDLSLRGRAAVGLQVDLIVEGADGLRRLAAAADALLTRHGGCTGCALQKTCGTCMPLAS
ncbi:MAG TPA: hypothetical protein VF223_17940, partial [Trebonia sp.]